VVRATREENTVNRLLRFDEYDKVAVKVEDSDGMCK